MTSGNPFGSPGAESDDDDFDIDLGDAEGGIEVGVYAMRVLDVEKQVSKAGNDMWTWTFVVTGDDKGKACDADGTELKLWTALTPAALWKLIEVVQALGIEVVDGKIKAKKKDLVGKTCFGNVEMREYQGRDVPSLDKCMASAA